MMDTNINNSCNFCWLLKSVRHSSEHFQNCKGIDLTDKNISASCDLDPQTTGPSSANGLAMCNNSNKMFKYFFLKLFGQHYCQAIWESLKEIQRQKKHSHMTFKLFDHYPKSPNHAHRDLDLKSVNHVLCMSFSWDTYFCYFQTVLEVSKKRQKIL